MSREEVIQTLRANVDRAVRVIFVDGETQVVIVANLDDEGFVDQVGDEFFWTAFESVSEVQPESERI
ncbi:MAG: hypothetical protein JO182_28580 [Acidobacteriaceae bacterium]|nr:hypothetical protein [Acidobacteriaceae bacterium]MBV9038478.1 hypothetical protein [Acidobacteriaceae bacterium]